MVRVSQCNSVTQIHTAYAVKKEEQNEKKTESDNAAVLRGAHHITAVGRHTHIADNELP